MAENTGRSGQPVQKLGGRGGSGAMRLGNGSAVRLDLRQPSLQRVCAPAIACRGRPTSPVATDQRRVLAGFRQHVLAVQPGIEIGLAQDLPDRLLEELGRALLHHQHRPLAGAEARNLLGHQRMGDIQHMGGDRDVAVRIGQARHCQAPVEHVEQAALHDDAELAVLGSQRLVELVVDDELLCRGQPPLDLVGLLPEGGRRMAQALVAEGRGLREPARGRHGRGHVVAAP